MNIQNMNFQFRQIFGIASRSLRRSEKAPEKNDFLVIAIRFHTAEKERSEVENMITSNCY